MNIRAQSYVVGEIPTIVVRIFIDHELIPIPKPIVAVDGVIIGHGEVKAPEPESSRAATFNPIDVPSAEAAGEAAMLPRLVLMIAGIVRP